MPEGVIHYLTQVGMNELLTEKEMLTKERDHLEITNENERRIAANHINAKLQLLNNRISTAKIVDLKKQPHNEIRFGALVTLKIGDDSKLQQYQIVGVDEADISKGKISFISPIARILTDKKVEEKAMLKHTPIHRLGEAEDIAGTVLYFAAPISSWTSGQVIFINGGGEQTLDM